MEDKRRWFRAGLGGIVRDLLLIICGILGAFAVDAWWEEAAEREDESVLLRDLASEFQGVSAEIERRRTGHETLLGGLESVQDHLSRVPVSQSVSIPDSTLAWLFPYFTLDLPSGVLARAVATGDIALLGDETLQRRLAAWPARVSDVAEDEAVARSFVYQQVVPALTDDASSVLAARLNQGRRSGGEVEVVVTPTIRNLVAGRIRLERNTLSSYVTLRSALDSIVSGLDH